MSHEYTSPALGLKHQEIARPLPDMNVCAEQAPSSSGRAAQAYAAAPSPQRAPRPAASPQHIQRRGLLGALMNLPVTAISGSLGLLSGVIRLSAAAVSFIGSNLLPAPWYNKIRGRRPSMKSLTKQKPLVLKASQSSHFCASLKTSANSVLYKSTIYRSTVCVLHCYGYQGIWCKHARGGAPHFSRHASDRL